MNRRFIGLMSGTSLDGVDGVLASFGDAASSMTLEVLAHVHRPFPNGLGHELLSLNTSGADELHRAAIAGNALSNVYAEVVASLLAQATLPAAEVTAIGAHGQTVRHCPGEFDGIGYTLQLGNPAWLAERTGIDVIADFRSRDVAAGGQGAPLVPAFHRAAFGRTDETIAVLNVGGISNLSVLSADGATIGFDCGPGNALMDHWCATYRGEPYDHGGAWAASGAVDPTLLHVMQQDPYFSMTPPKSTGRDRFNPEWLDRLLRTRSSATTSATTSPQDVQATLAELTAWCCASSLRTHAPSAHRLLVCGGGAFNGHLMRRLAAHLPGLPVESTNAFGLPVDQVEAAAFAWLARAWVDRHAGNLPTVTGASGPRILGALYPAK